MFDKDDNAARQRVRVLRDNDACDGDLVGGVMMVDGHGNDDGDLVES